MESLAALTIYLILVGIVVFYSSRKVHSVSDFIVGSRSLNFWLTAMSAHASDMSSWMFMAYPAVIFVGGLFNSWLSIGLFICMLANWTFLAPRLRIETERYNCSTFSSYLQKRFQDSSGILSLMATLFCFIFYVVYLSANLASLGIIAKTLFGFDYHIGTLTGVILVIGYVIGGGYITLAWLDLIQGMFLLAMIWLVPLTLIHNAIGWNSLFLYFDSHPSLVRLMPESGLEVISAISLIFGWGLGYFGQPHIITKFMGIKNPSDIPKSRLLGMIWMLLSLTASTLVGLAGIAWLDGSLINPELVFVDMVRALFSPFWGTFVLCAVLAAILNVMSSQLLILGSLISEDLYHRFSMKDSSPNLLKISRIAVLVVGIIAYGIASIQISSIFILVNYAWSGLGSAFGPLILGSLYCTKVNRYGAIASMISGGSIAALWPYINVYLPISIDSMLPGFFFGWTALLTTSYLTANGNCKSSLFKSHGPDPSPSSRHLKNNN